jgi:deoxyribonuclease-4
VAGNPPAFFASSFGGDRLNAPEWLSHIGLDAIELQCTRGVRMTKTRAVAFRAAAEQFGIEVSIHGPYFISLGNPDSAVGENSLNELRKCVELARHLGSSRIVFHPGSAGDDRAAALKRAIRRLRQFEHMTDLSGIWLCPEITGKSRQLGSLDDVLAIASELESARPCLDLAHFHARTSGSLRSRRDIAAVLDTVEQALGWQALSECHFHYYPIEWGPCGEIRHRAFEDQIEPIAIHNDGPHDTHFLPRPEPFVEELVGRGLTPLVICEARDSQDRGAAAMKRLWNYLSDDSSRDRLRTGKRR